MSEFSLNIFLLTAASAPRITQGLLDQGFTVGANFKNKKSVSVSEGKPSACYAIKIKIETLRFKEIIEIRDLIEAFLERISVPYFGFTIENEKDRTWSVSLGHFPKPEPEIITPAGPYRTPASPNPPKTGEEPN